MTHDRTELPAEGVPRSTLEAQLKSMPPDAVHGHWSRAFRGPEDVQEVGRMAYNMFLSDNGIFSLRSEYIRRIEEEVIGMCVSLFNAPEDASGTFTSGGSESNYSALHAMREWAREHHPHITAPEVIVPFSAHPTFSKGCHYFGLKLVRTALGKDLRADVSAMAEAIGPNTIAIAGSAPCWPYGLYDPIAAISDLAVKHDLWMHVDACVGGYLAPFVESLGHPLPAWDFRVPGVKSISADLHKYGYCPKPASTVLWRSESLKRFHHVHPEDWPGGPYQMQGFAGSRTAGPIFAAWTVLKYLGRSGYRRLAAQLLDTSRRLAEGIESVEGMYVFKSDLMPLGFGSHVLDMQLIMGGLRKIGWLLVASRQPPLINLPVDGATGDAVINAFVADLRKVAAAVRAGADAGRAELTY
jgi:glutamate/tyrosine decarboxylase-like PLP-dependent enzyme